MASGIAKFNSTLFNGSTVSNNQLVLSSSLRQYMTVPPFSVRSAGITFTFWFRSNNNANYARVFDFGNGPRLDIINVNWLSSGFMQFACFAGSNYTNGVYNMVGSYNDNVLRHFAWVLDPVGTWTIFVNGVKMQQISSMNYPASISRSSNYLGRSNWNSDPYFNGAIGDFRLYDRMLRSYNDNVLRHFAWVMDPIGTWTIFVNGVQMQQLSSMNYPASVLRSSNYLGRRSYNDNVLRHFVWVLDFIGIWTIFVDGVQVQQISSMNYPASISRSSNYLGRSNWNGDPYFNGAIGDFRLYDRMLSASEVQTLYFLTTGLSSSMILHYSFKSSSISGTAVANMASGIAKFNSTLFNGSMVSNNQLVLSRALRQYMT
eukprot:gene61809-biopygen28738